MDLFKEAAYRVRDRLKSLDCHIKLTQAQEAVAAVNGYRDWHTLIASVSHKSDQAETATSPIELIPKERRVYDDEKRLCGFKTSEGIIRFDPGSMTDTKMLKLITCLLYTSDAADE